MTVAVTGADGFAGSCLVSILERAGNNVVACVRSTPLKNLSPTRRVKVVYADLMDPRSLEDAFWGVEKVYHLAAVSGIVESRAKPNTTVQSNVGGTHNVIQAALAAGVPRVLYTSTCHVKGYDIYAASKRAAEMVCQAYKGKIQIVITRAYNHYGPGQRPEWVIPDFIEKALMGKPIVVNSPDAVRDFTYVSDVMNAYTFAMDGSVPFEPVEIGTGVGRTMKSIAEDVARLTNYSGKIQFGVPRPDDVDSMVCEDRRIYDMGWKPAVSWEDGLKVTIEWYRKRLGLAG